MFALKILRKATGLAIFDTNLPGLIFSEQFVQLPVRNPQAPQYIIFQIRLPSENLYGIGENEQHEFRHNFSTWKVSLSPTLKITSSQVWPLYARDHPPAGEPVYRFNMYGVHPRQRTQNILCHGCRYTLVEEDGSTHSVIFINSNAQEFETFPLPGLVYRTIGTELFSRN